MPNFMRFDFARGVWRNSTDGGASFSDAGWCLLSGTLANRPAAGVANRLYIATDVMEVSFDNGTIWTPIAADIGKVIGGLPQYEDDGAGNPVVNHPNMPLVGGDAVVEQGSNADGSFIRWASGMQLCFATVTLVFDIGSDRLNKTWTFPKAFTAGPNVQHNPDNLPITNENGGVSVSFDITTTSVRLEQYRIAGGTNFTSGDSADTYATAWGRWK